MPAHRGRRDAHVAVYVGSDLRELGTLRLLDRWIDQHQYHARSPAAPIAEP